MSIELTERDDKAIITINGVFGYQDLTSFKKIHDRVKNHAYVEIDISACKSIDPCGLGILYRLKEDGNKKRLKIVNSPTRSCSHETMAVLGVVTELAEELNDNRDSWDRWQVLSQLFEKYPHLRDKFPADRAHCSASPKGCATFSKYQQARGSILEVISGSEFHQKSRRSS
ncbi:MAG: hypothetical protein HQL52_08975 [Magnetococcales bacterium]|nr:hypothetical protein [Magnetococcales bacterium]